MRILKTNPVLTIFNSYLVDSPQPSSISYLYNFGSLLGLSLVVQIITGIFLAMHFAGTAELAFSSAEHIMRDVNDGWLLRYTHANMASFFFVAVYLHIARGLYYGSYRSPRIGVWVIGTIIFFLMMAIQVMWPNWMLINDIKVISSNILSNLPFSKSRTKAIYRIGPHNIDILSVLICGMLGDWWGHKIKTQSGSSVRFSIEQSINNSAYIHHLTNIFNNWGYSSYIVPKLVKKSESKNQNSNLLNNKNDRFNYRLTLFTFSSLIWIYDSFYIEENGKIIKKVPVWIDEFVTPIGLAHWIMQDGSRQSNQGIYIATNSFTYEECDYLCKILEKKYKLRATVVKTGHVNQWRISIWKESMVTLVSIVKPYIIDEMKYKFKDYI
jgi:ubiquinol-cytochrome c reductase cytochrome b subunit